MSYTNERDQFIHQMTREGLPLHSTLALLRVATTMQRLAELACSSAAADRDRVPCPENPCLCDYSPQDARHATIPRITLQDHRAEQRAQAAVPAGWRVISQGDPRGYVLRVIPPSYAERNAGRDRHNLDSIGVPSRPSGLRF